MSANTYVYININKKKIIISRIHGIMLNIVFSITLTVRLCVYVDYKIIYLKQRCKT